jgi:ribosome-associated protein
VARSNAIAASTLKPRRAPAEPKTEVRSEAAEESRTLAIAIAKAALDKKAVNVQIVDVVGRVDYTDFLVLMSGRSDRHVLSVADGIEEELIKLTPKRKPTAVEGRPQGNWVVLDYGEVVAHVFQEDVRSFYDLDTLWQDARKIPVSEQRPVPTA